MNMLAWRNLFSPASVPIEPTRRKLTTMFCCRLVLCLMFLISTTLSAPYNRTDTSDSSSTPKIEESEEEDTELRRVKLEKSIEDNKGLDEIFKYFISYVSAHLSKSNQLEDLNCKSIRQEAQIKFVFHKLKGKIFPNKKPTYTTVIQPSLGITKYSEILPGNSKPSNDSFKTKLDSNKTIDHFSSRNNIIKWTGTNLKIEKDNSRGYKAHIKTYFPGNNSATKVIPVTDTKQVINNKSSVNRTDLHNLQFAINSTDYFNHEAINNTGNSLNENFMITLRPMALVTDETSNNNKKETMQDKYLYYITQSPRLINFSQQNSSSNSTMFPESSELPLITRESSLKDPMAELDYLTYQNNKKSSTVPSNSSQFTTRYEFLNQVTNGLQSNATSSTANDTYMYTNLNLGTSLQDIAFFTSPDVHLRTINESKLSGLSHKNIATETNVKPEHNLNQNILSTTSSYFKELMVSSFNINNDEKLINSNRNNLSSNGYYPTYTILSEPHEDKRVTFPIIKNKSSSYADNLSVTTPINEISFGPTLSSNYLTKPTLGKLLNDDNSTLHKYLSNETALILDSLNLVTTYRETSPYPLVTGHLTSEALNDNNDSNNKSELGVSTIKHGKLSHLPGNYITTMVDEFNMISDHTHKNKVTMDFNIFPSDNSHNPNNSTMNENQTKSILKIMSSLGENYPTSSYQTVTDSFSSEIVELSSIMDSSTASDGLKITTNILPNLIYGKSQQSYDYNTTTLGVRFNSTQDHTKKFESTVDQNTFSLDNVTHNTNNSFYSTNPLILNFTTNFIPYVYTTPFTDQLAMNSMTSEVVEFGDMGNITHNLKNSSTQNGNESHTTFDHRLFETITNLKQHNHNKKNNSVGTMPSTQKSIDSTNEPFTEIKDVTYPIGSNYSTYIPKMEFSNTLFNSSETQFITSHDSESYSTIEARKELSALASKSTTDHIYDTSQILRSLTGINIIENKSHTALIDSEGITADNITNVIDNFDSSGTSSIDDSTKKGTFLNELESYPESYAINKQTPSFTEDSTEQTKYMTDSLGLSTQTEYSQPSFTTSMNNNNYNYLKISNDRITESTVSKHLFSLNQKISVENSNMISKSTTHTTSNTTFTLEPNKVHVTVSEHGYSPGITSRTPDENPDNINMEDTTKGEYMILQNVTSLYNNNTKSYDSAENSSSSLSVEFQTFDSNYTRSTIEEVLTNSEVPVTTSSMPDWNTNIYTTQKYNYDFKTTSNNLISVQNVSISSTEKASEGSTQNDQIENVTGNTFNSMMTVYNSFEDQDISTSSHQTVEQQTNFLSSSNYDTKIIDINDKVTTKTYSNTDTDINSLPTISTLLTADGNNNSSITDDISTIDQSSRTTTPNYSIETRTENTRTVETTTQAYGISYSTPYINISTMFEIDYNVDSTTLNGIDAVDKANDTYYGKVTENRALATGKTTEGIPNTITSSNKLNEGSNILTSASALHESGITETLLDKKGKGTTTSINSKYHTDITLKDNDQSSAEHYETTTPGLNNFTFYLPTTDFNISYLPLRIHPIVFHEIK